MVRFGFWVLVRALALTALLGATLGFGLTLGEEELADIREMGDKILLEHPPGEWIIVGIGRSPAPIVAYLQERVKDYALNLPISAMKNRLGLSGADPRARKAAYAPLMQVDEEDLFRHFDRYLPAENAIAGKKVLILDFAKGSEGIFSFHDYFKKYLKSSGRSHATRPLAMTLASTEAAVREYANLSNEEFELMVMSDHRALGQNLHAQKYKDFSEYGFYSVGSVEPSRNPLYEKLVTQISEGTKKLPTVEAGASHVQHKFVAADPIRAQVEAARQLEAEKYTAELKRQRQIQDQRRADEARKLLDTPGVRGLCSRFYELFSRAVPGM